MQTNQKPISVGQFLLDRLYELGVRDVFGVPGDYVLRLDKLIEQHHLRFINTTRENPAGQAADAYARIKGLGVAVITYGVGVNITNALAQAYVESSPLIVISGTAGTDEFKKHPLMHHLINKSISTYGDKTQLDIFKNVTVDQGLLDRADQAEEIIDRVLTTCLQQKKPVYLEIPRNLVDQPLPTQTIQPFSWNYPPSDPATLQEALTECQKIFSTCQKPLIWAGHEILRFGLSEELLRFAEIHQIPIVSSLLGKTVISEHHPLFAGVYQGEMSRQEIIDLVHSCDCLFSAGVVLDDLDTGIFTAKLDQEQRIQANSYSLMMGHHHYPSVSLVDFIKGLKSIKRSQPFFQNHTPRHTQLEKTFIPKNGAPATTARLFQCIQSHLKAEHLIVSDVGDCLFGSADLVLHQQSFISCPYFASLGFGTPGAIGAQIADPKKRVFAIVGDGGFQMTAMELAAAIRYQLDPIVIIMNNHGYGTERPLLEGSYNEILNWNYTEIVKVIGGGIALKVKTEKELNDALDQAFSRRGNFFLIEVELEKLDFSPALQRLGALLGKVVKK